MLWPEACVLTTELHGPEVRGGILSGQGAALRPQQGDEMLAAVGLALFNQLKPRSSGLS